MLNQSIKSNIKLAIIDDHQLVRTAIVNLVNQEPGFTVEIALEDCPSFLSHPKANQIDVLLLDLSLKNETGFKYLSQLHRQFPDLKIIILTMHQQPDYARHAFRHHAHGYVLKDDAYDQLMIAIRLAMSGETYISPTLSQHITNSYINSNNRGPSFDLLTKSENVIMELVAEGLTNQQIAEHLQLSRRTIETHRSHILKKTNCKNTVELITAYLDHKNS